MAHPRRTALAALAALAALGGAGCARRSPCRPRRPVDPGARSAPPSRRPGSGPGPDLRQLLIDPADIAVARLPAAHGAATGRGRGRRAGGHVRHRPTGERQLGTTIVLLPDPAAAQDATAGAASSTGEQRTGARSAPAPVGDHAVIFTGYELAGTASTLLLFSQGTASVAMDFRSPSTDPIPTAAVIETGTRQAARLRPAFG